MPRICLACTHPDKEAIDQALLRGEALPRISALYSLSKNSLVKHKANHIPEHLTKAKAAEEMARADALLVHLTDLYKEATELSQAAKRTGDIRAGFIGIRERKGILELLLELAGRLDRRPTVNLLVSPEWLQLRTALLTILHGYPEVREAVGEKLLQLESANGHESRA